MLCQLYHSTRDQGNFFFNKLLRFSFLKIFANFFDSEWSFAQAKLECYQTKIIFSEEPGEIISIDRNGNYQKIYFDRIRGGSCTIKEKLRLIE